MMIAKTFDREKKETNIIVSKVRAPVMAPVYVLKCTLVINKSITAPTYFLTTNSGKISI